MSKVEVIEAQQKVEAELAGLRDVAHELSDRVVATREAVEENMVFAAFTIGVIGLALFLGNLITKRVLH
ncbi:MAG: hypothetical protein AABZ31_08550 [Bdellovibrionota bacterium]